MSCWFAILTDVLIEHKNCKYVHTSFVFISSSSSSPLQEPSQGSSSRSVTWPLNLLMAVSVWKVSAQKANNATAARTQQGRMSLTFGCVLKVNIECLNGDHVGGLED